MQDMTFAELDSEMVTMLPSKETLFLNFSWANISATNSALAFNAVTANSNAVANALQGITVMQGG